MFGKLCAGTVVLYIYTGINASRLTEIPLDALLTHGTRYFVSNYLIEL